MTELTDVTAKPMSEADSPALIEWTDGSAPALVNSVRVNDNGWLWLRTFDDRTMRFPPHAVARIEYAETEWDGDVLEGNKVLSDGVAEQFSGREFEVWG
ncbi:hypothetical protein [Natronorarus salvus]|uniref:hypothetical protein n=1 Tax=Natronorarus salvus TaxID=3117733 RepID=UPI002F2686B5